MTDKELRHLSRSELLEMLIAQMEENKKLKEKLKKTQKALSDRRIIINQAGSIADAALQLNGVFDAAQTAAAQYLENIQRLSGEQETVCRQMEENARKKAEDVRSKANAYSWLVRSKADAYWRQVSEKAGALLQDQKDTGSPALQDGKEDPV